MLSKEEIQPHIELVKLKEYKANSTEKALVTYIEQLENKLKESEEIKDKYLQKIVDTLVVKKELDDNKNNKLKQIISNNIDLDVYNLRIKLAEEF